MPIYTTLGRTMVLTLCLHPKSSVRLKAYLYLYYLLLLLILWLLTSPLPFATVEACWLEVWWRGGGIGEIVSFRALWPIGVLLVPDKRGLHWNLLLMSMLCWVIRPLGWGWLHPCCVLITGGLCLYCLRSTSPLWLGGLLSGNPQVHHLSVT